MSLASKLKLAADVEIVRVSDLPRHIRDTLVHQRGDHVALQHNSRGRSFILDADLAHILASFRDPRTLGEVLAEFVDARKLDADSVLDAALPVFATLKLRGFVVEASEDVRAAFRPPIASIGRWIVLECLQDLPGAAVFRCESEGIASVLKLGSGEASPSDLGTVRYEAECLRHMPDGLAPRLLDVGKQDGRDYLALSYVAGNDVLSRCNELRRRSPQMVANICKEVVRSYSRLESAGILHADVHPKNVLVDGQQNVWLVDFALSRPSSGPGKSTPRAGVPYFFDPQHAAGQLASPVTTIPYDSYSEQYGVGALCYLLLCGWHHLDFMVNRNHFLAQIRDEPMNPFLYYGEVSRPQVEAVLRRALAKTPADRFRTIGALAEALTAAIDVDFGDCASIQPSPGRRAIPAFSVGEMPTTMADADAHDGFAGTALAYLFLAELSADPSELAESTVWSTRATALASRPSRTRGPADISLHHGRLGIDLVAAKLAAAQGDTRGVSSFVHKVVGIAANAEEYNLDLIDGSSGAVLACATILSEMAAATSEGNLEEARQAGRALAARTWQQWYATLAKAGDRAVPLGMAHGWAGVLYAQMSWAKASSGDLPADLGLQLEQLIALASESGGGLEWPAPTWKGPPRSFLRASWCNGTAGFVFLLCLAADVLHEPSYLEHAAKAAAVTWADPCSSGCLCCGLAGRSFALLKMYRQTQERIYLERATDLALRAAGPTSTGPSTSLYKGSLGAKLAGFAVLHPAKARMPLFEL